MDPAEGGSRWRRAGKWALRIALTVAVTWAILDRIGVSVAELRGLDARWLRPAPGSLVAGSVLLGGGYVLSATFWGRLVRELGGPDTGFAERNRIYFTANLGRYLPGKVWQIAGLAYLARDAGVSPLVATGAAVVGQALTLVGAFLVGAGALASLGPAWSAVVPWAAGAVGAVVVVVSVPPVFRRFVSVAFRVAGEAPPDAVEAGGIGPSFGVRWIALYAVNWVAYGAGFWLLARSFGVSGGIVAVGGAFAAAYLLGYLAVFAPAGIGVREGVLAALLSPVATPEAGVALAVVARLWATVVELVPVAAFGGRRLLRDRPGGRDG